MTRTSGGISPLRQNILNNQGFDTAKEMQIIAIIIQLRLNLLILSQEVQVKHRQGNVLGEMTVGRREIYPPKRKRQKY